MNAQFPEQVFEISDLQYFYYSRFGKSTQYQYAKIDVKRKYRKWMKLLDQKRIQDMKAIKLLERKVNRINSGIDEKEEKADVDKGVEAGIVDSVDDTAAEYIEV